MFFHSGFCQCDRIHVFYLHREEGTAKTNFVTAVHSVLILLELCYRRKVSSLAAITTVSSELLPCLSVSSSTVILISQELWKIGIALWCFSGCLRIQKCTISAAVTFALQQPLQQDSEYAENEWRIAIQRCPAIFSFLEERLTVVSWSWELFLEQGSR